MYLLLQDRITTRPIYVSRRLYVVDNALLRAIPKISGLPREAAASAGRRLFLEAEGLRSRSRGRRPRLATDPRLIEEEPEAVGQPAAGIGPMSKVARHRALSHVLPFYLELSVVP